MHRPRRDGRRASRPRSGCGSRRSRRPTTRRRTCSTGHGITVRVVRGDRDVPVALVARVPAGRGADADRTERHARSTSSPTGSTIDLPDNQPSFSLVRVGRRLRHRPRRHGVPRPAAGSVRAAVHRLAHPDPRRGEVADSVHFHRIRFQMIFCARGWVDLVYEDQGEPFRLEAGDCVLQPPEIRHRVLRSSPGLEVIEIGCPAVHDTFIEHDDRTARRPLSTPTRDFGGQRFVRHVAADAGAAPVADRRAGRSATPASVTPPTASPGRRGRRVDGRQRRPSRPGRAVLGHDARVRVRRRARRLCRPAASTTGRGDWVERVGGTRCDRLSRRHGVGMERTGPTTSSCSRSACPPMPSCAASSDRSPTAQSDLASTSNRSSDRCRHAGSWPRMSPTAPPIDERSTLAMNALSVRWLSTHPGSSAHGGRYLAGFTRPWLRSSPSAAIDQRSSLPENSRPSVSGRPAMNADRTNVEIDRKPDRYEQSFVNGDPPVITPPRKLRRVDSNACSGVGAAVEEPAVDLDEVGAVDHHLHGEDPVGEPAQPVEVERARHVLGVDGEALLGAGGAGVADRQDRDVGLLPAVHARWRRG